MLKLFTIGHSNYSFGRFIELLQAYEVTAICDVRGNALMMTSREFTDCIFASDEEFRRSKASLESF